MKDLFIIPECYIDTNLVETLIITDGCNHQKGCNTVVKTMQQKFANAFSVGIIDEDKRQVSYVKEFSEIARTPSLRLKKHGSKSHYLIMVSPAMDLEPCFLSRNEWIFIEMCGRIRNQYGRIWLYFLFERIYVYNKVCNQ